MPPKRKDREGDAPSPDAADEDDEGQRRADDLADEDLEERVERRMQENARLGDKYDKFVRCATDEQLDRFDNYKRSKFPRAVMRKMMTETLGHSSERGAIALASIAKMFVGEMVELSREQMTAAGETGPIQPHHLRCAYRRMQDSGVVPNGPRYTRAMGGTPLREACAARATRGAGACAKRGVGAWRQVLHRNLHRAKSVQRVPKPNQGGGAATRRSAACERGLWRGLEA
eukprot:6507704-Prymnesium_polylepis.1